VLSPAQVRAKVFQLLGGGSIGLVLGSLAMVSFTTQAGPPAVATATIAADGSQGSGLGCLQVFPRFMWVLETSPFFHLNPFLQPSLCIVVTATAGPG